MDVTSGSVVPFDGFLVPESTFIAYQRQTIENRLLDLQLKSVIRQQEELLTSQYQKESWWDANKFWIGVGTGVVGTITVVFATAYVLDKLPK